MRFSFTSRGIDALEPKEKRIDYWDSSFPCFGIRITSSGKRTWFVMYRYRERNRRLTIGSFPNLSLADAREIAKDALHQVAKGADPAGQKKVERQAETIANLATEYIEKHAKPKKRSWKKDERMLHNELLPDFGHHKVNEITRKDVIRILDRIRDRGAPIMANRALEIFRKMFNFAVEREIIQINPCYKISKPSKENSRDRVLSENEIATVWNALNSEHEEVAATFRLRLLTAQRGGEIRSMRWQDLDLKAGWWTIPKESAKNGHSHRVPLTPMTLEIIRQQLKHRFTSEWVFPGTAKEGHLEHLYNAAKRIAKRSSIAFVGHDLRRTAASHMTSIGVPRLIVSKILNHTERGVTAVYDRHSYDAEKKDALEKWELQLKKILSSEVLTQSEDTSRIEAVNSVKLKDEKPENQRTVY